MFFVNFFNNPVSPWNTNRSLCSRWLHLWNQRITMNVHWAAKPLNVCLRNSFTPAIIRSTRETTSASPDYSRNVPCYLPVSVKCWGKKTNRVSLPQTALTPSAPSKVKYFCPHVPCPWGCRVCCFLRTRPRHCHCPDSPCDRPWGTGRKLYRVSNVIQDTFNCHLINLINLNVELFKQAS